MKRREIKQYEFLRKIGAGGSGVVYLANDTLLQRPVTECHTFSARPAPLPAIYPAAYSRKHLDIDHRN